MTHPLRAARAPFRGPSPDTKGPVDLLCLARSRAAGAGAACKARQRPGEAGSAAFAGFDLFPAARVAPDTLKD